MLMEPDFTTNANKTEGLPKCLSVEVWPRGQAQSTMDPEGARFDHPDRRTLNPWRHYEPLPEDNASQADRTLLSFKERMATISTVEQTWESTKGHPDLPRKPQDARPEGGARTRRRLERARMSPWWWMPEILSQLGAILCLTGTLN